MWASTSKAFLIRKKTNEGHKPRSSFVAYMFPAISSYVHVFKTCPGLNQSPWVEPCTGLQLSMNYGFITTGLSSVRVYHHGFITTGLSPRVYRHGLINYVSSNHDCGLLVWLVVIIATKLETTNTYKKVRRKFTR